MQAADFFPPVLLKAIKKFSKPGAGIEVYESFSQAETTSGSYDDVEISGIVLEKTKQFIQNLNSSVENKLTIQNLLAVQTAVCFKTRLPGANKLNVIEIGGACGAFFHQASYFFSANIDRWYIVETPAMVKAGNQNFANSQLEFETDYDTAISKLNSKDFCTAQGVIQYTPDPANCSKKY